MTLESTPKRVGADGDVAAAKEASGMGSWRTVAATAISVVGVGYHLYVLGISPMSPGIFRPIHVLFLTLLAVVAFPVRKSGRAGVFWLVFDLACAALVLASTAFIIYDQTGWAWRAGMMPNNTDIIFGTATVATVLVMTQRVFGWPLVVLALVFIGYAMFGSYAPGTLKIVPYSFARVIGQLYSVDNGVFGLLIGVSATYILPFVVLGSVLAASGAGELFMDLAKALTGRSRGGPAKIAVVSSALFGTISGSGAANVVATGTFTIPLMMKTGYEPHFAAAVEAVASTGGQIMPPIMASAAFLMAEILGISYGRVALAAAIPALLYFLGVYVGVDLEAGRLGLRTLTTEEMPNVKTLVLTKGYLLLPLVAVVYMLVVANASPIRAGLTSLVVAFVVSWFGHDTRLTPSRLIRALAQAAKEMVPIGMACAAAGIVVGMLGLTGLGVKVTEIVISLSKGQILPALALTMLVALILGMGLPTAASYIIAASVCAPALVKMGIEPLAAHLFVFYFACMCAITPPVALAAYAAAGIAKENPLKVGLTSVRLGLVAFIVPYMFIYGPALLMDAPLLAVIRVTLTSVIGVVAIGLALEGWLTKPIALVFRALFLLGGLLLIETRVATDVTGLAMLAMAWIGHRQSVKRAVAVGGQGSPSLAAGRRPTEGAKSDPLRM